MEDPTIRCDTVLQTGSGLVTGPQLGDTRLALRQCQCVKCKRRNNMVYCVIVRVEERPGHFPPAGVKDGVQEEVMMPAAARGCFENPRAGGGLQCPASD